MLSANQTRLSTFRKREQPDDQKQEKADPAYLYGQRRAISDLPAASLSREQRLRHARKIYAADEKRMKRSPVRTIMKKAQEMIGTCKAMEKRELCALLVGM